MTANELCLCISALGVAALIYFTGYQRGKATGWLDHYFTEEARKKAMRDSHGRFAGKKGAV